MKKCSKMFILLAFVAAGTGLPSIAAKAQFDQAPPPTDNQDFANPDQPAPIDGGLAFLLAAGVGYGLRKHRESKRQKEKEKMR